MRIRAQSLLTNLIGSVFVALCIAVGVTPTKGFAALPYNGDALTLPNQTDFKLMMNYELGMHCTGFEFAYCCVLPVYNSILAQVVKPEGGDNDFPRLLEADPHNNVASILAGGTGDVLGRHTVVRDPAELDANGNFQKYVMRYWHDAQPRNDGNGKGQTSTLISAVEGNSLLSWNTIADAAALNADGGVVMGEYNGSENVVLGNGSYADMDAVFTSGAAGAVVPTPIDNYQNTVWNHLYIKEVSARGVEGYGGNPNGASPESAKIRLGLHVGYPTNFGPAGHGMEGLLTFSGEHGTVVYTQMKVLEDLPITLTSPRIWEALGLPLTPFEDTIDFFGDPGLVDEDSIRPYVQMKAQLYHADCDGSGTCTEGNAVLDGSGNPVIGFGTAPIDIPNCERCHSGFDQPNSPNISGTPEAALVQEEIDFWMAYYPGLTTGTDWYARLKGAAISILAIHDEEHGTAFTEYYPAVECADASCTTLTAPVAGSAGDLLPSGDPRAAIPQNTRLGHESVICQKCHADNVIAVVKSANCGPGQGCDSTDPRNQLYSNITGATLIPPLTEAIHYNHREVSEGGPIDFADGEGRSGGCQGCHPAHRSDGDMSAYPIDLAGNNTFADGDNRDAAGGCFVGRDVHSNPMKDSDGAETPSHLNPVGQWLADNVDNGKGIWCTNCHSQAGQQMWKAENVESLVHAQPGDPGHVREPFEGAGLADVVNAVNAALGTTTDLTTFIEWLDPGTHRATDRTSAIWEHDPGMCAHAAGLLGLAEHNPAQDGNVATIEIAIGSTDGSDCSTGVGLPGPDCFGTGNPSFFICGSLDVDPGATGALADVVEAVTGGIRANVNVALMDFCTTPDCVAAAQATLDANGGAGCDPLNGGGGNCAVPVPFSAASDGRDHWLSAGEPHCADCHAAPYVEQSGNINAFAPFNYPRKASLMRYSRGHQDITCQGCHESIHGLYPVTPTIDTTSYWQAASLNADNSHGPVKCGGCHDVNTEGVWRDAKRLEYNGTRIKNDFDAAVSWMHTFTDEASPVDSGFCENCHKDKTNKICDGTKGGSCDWTEGWLEHADKGRVSRNTMDQTELEQVGYIAGTGPQDPLTSVCEGCHGDESNKVNCNNTEWKVHLTEGRVNTGVWETVSTQLTGSTCGW